MTNLEQEFVPYQESSELKELGFDEPCFCYYDEEDNAGRIYEYANCNRNVTGGRACYNDNFLSVTNSQLDRYGAFSAKDEGGENSFSRWTAPTFSQAFRWFREKYNLDGAIVGQQWRRNEEAELACLRKLIEIVKSIHRETN